MTASTSKGEDVGRDEVLVAQAIAFLSAERHKIKPAAKYAEAFTLQFIPEARRVMAALKEATP